MSPKWADDVISKFKYWLTSVDGQHKNQRCASQRSRQVMLILKTISPKEFDLITLFDRQLIRDKWLTPFDSVRCPGTVRTYLGSLKLFYEFVLCDVPLEVKCTTKECYQMITIVKNWGSSYKKKIKVGKFERGVEDLSRLLSPEEMHEFDHSDAVDESRDNIKKSSLLFKATSVKNFTSARDYILSSIILSNASRPGAIRNMTLKEFGTAKRSENGVYLVGVLDHKTAATSGPAMIAFTNLLYEECKQFVQYMRNKLPGVGMDKSDPIFVSWTGRKMSSSMVGDQFSSFFYKATNHNLIARKTRKITATLVRKSFVSTAHNDLPELKKKLSNMMCHSETTAANTYFLEEKAKNIPETFMKMQRAMRLEKNCGNVDAEVQTIFKDEVNGQNKITLSMVREKADRIATIPLSEVQIRNKLRYAQQNISQQNKVDLDYKPEDQSEFSDEDSVSLSSHCSSVSDRVVYSKAEEGLIEKYFPNLLLPYYLVKAKDVENTLNSQPELREMKKKFGIRKILIKIRSMERKLNER